MSLDKDTRGWGHEYEDRTELLRRCQYAPVGDAPGDHRHGCDRGQRTAPPPYLLRPARDRPAVAARSAATRTGTSPGAPTRGSYTAGGDGGGSTRSRPGSGPGTGDVEAV